MQPETEYRARAAYCVRVSETAKNAAHRVALLQQAQTLLRMADEAARIEQLLQGEERMASSSVRVGVRGPLACSPLLPAPAPVR